MTSTRDAGRDFADALTSPRLRLRPLEDSELETVEAWWNEPATLVFQTTAAPPRPSGRWTEQLKTWHANAEDGSVGFAVAAREDDALLGTVALHSITATGQAATFGIMLGSPAQGRGYGHEATRLMVDYGFRMLPLHRIGLAVWSYNDRAQKVYESAGFTVEGRHREVVFLDGAWHDEIHMSILRSEWSPTEWE